jgi:hypothetical protein
LASRRGVWYQLTKAAKDDSHRVACDLDRRHRFNCVHAEARDHDYRLDSTPQSFEGMSVLDVGA